ncbi:hypothetical protein DHEL01_v201606 [Diaporthe helianthi]|uniref:C2H2-type domain-containing protein n=1 Tax=Diaporthe helianthi TaxID=158607 RepID=A0A2P5IBX8_DIAHE|nr:hypothetical protein DHEL01_v201606 [Diaporthe helianthi]
MAGHSEEVPTLLREARPLPSSASKPVAIPASKLPLGRPTQAGESTESSYTTSEQTAATNTSCSSSSSPGLLSCEERKKKGKRPANSDERNGSENEGNEAPKHKKAKGDEAEVKRLACPFFKRNPHRYKDQGKCVGPGWLTVHRLKEHLYRRHMLPIYCYRCREIFPNDRLLCPRPAAK